MFEQNIDIEQIEVMITLFGNFDQNIKRIEKRHEVSITSHGSCVKIKGEKEKCFKMNVDIVLLLCSSDHKG